jgi:hypothetical protein
MPPILMWETVNNPFQTEPVSGTKLMRDICDL